MGYTYDNIGQLQSARGYESNGTSRDNEKFGYAYDAAHNLATRTNNALLQNFTADGLNQLSTGSRSGTLTVAGIVSTVATNVTVNGQTASLYADSTFAKSGFTVTNGLNAFTALAQKNPGTTTSDALSNSYPSAVTFVYDANGNLTSDGVRGFDYDDENQLTSITVTNSWKTEFAYDALMRRRIRKEYLWSASTWILASETRYLYHDKVIIQERDGRNIPKVTYTRGLDIANRLMRAGGIGGLLSRTDHSHNETSFYMTDGNGNVTMLLNSMGYPVAKYLYDPYGNILAMSGTIAGENVYRFASQEHHAQSGLLAYLYRFYDPNFQRWVNRDPIQESSDKNMFAAFHNSPTDYADVFGLGNFPFYFPPESHGPRFEKFKQRLQACLCELRRTPIGRRIYDMVRGLDFGVAFQETSRVTGIIDGKDDAGRPIVGLVLNDERINGLSPSTESTQKNPPPNDVRGCAVVLAHEFGHLLGGKDEDDRFFPGTNVNDYEDPLREYYGFKPREEIRGTPVTNPWR